MSSSPSQATTPLSFPRLALRNASRSRSENLIYFVTLIVAIASFYVITALPQQDVIVFLRDFESDAVSRLLSLMPLEYALALALLFFLVLLANTYQLGRRTHEFGRYLILGMPKSRLFGMLALESLVSSLIVLAAGLLIGAVCAELISLVTSRLLGQGIIVHQLSLSLDALWQTSLGFLAIQLLSLLILSLRLARREVASLLKGQVEKKQRTGTTSTNLALLLLGLALLAGAFFIAPRSFDTIGLGLMAITLVLCVGGIFATIKGFTRLLGLLALRSTRHAPCGLRVFNLRQLQEALVNRSSSVAAVSLLMMFAFMFLITGASLIAGNSKASDRTRNIYDFTVFAQPESTDPNSSGLILDREGNPFDTPESYQEALAAEDARIQATLNSAAFAPYVADLNPMRIGMMKVIYDLDSMRALPSSIDATNLLEAIDTFLAAEGSPPIPERFDSYSVDATTRPFQYTGLIHSPIRIRRLPRPRFALRRRRGACSPSCSKQREPWWKRRLCRRRCGEPMSSWTRMPSRSR